MFIEKDAWPKIMTIDDNDGNKTHLKYIVVLNCIVIAFKKEFLMRFK